MAKISLICEQCGGNIVLDNSHEIGTCEHCFAQFVVKHDQIVQKITQHITKHVYGYEGKDVEELLIDGYKFVDLGDEKKANAKFRQAINIEPDCWEAWLGYASTGGDRSGYLSIVPAYRKAYSIATEEKQEADTYVDMTRYLPDPHLRAAFVRAFNIASRKDRHNIFSLVSGVIGCDESEIASLAVDLCPEDWRAHFAMAKFRQIRVRWCELEGNFFTGKHLPAHAVEVLNIFMRAYRLAKNEGPEAKETVLSYINTLNADSSYRVFTTELNNQIRRDG
jgi:hypothetical protein